MIRNLLVLLSLSASAFAAEPVLQQIHPHGGQRGSAIELTLRGYGLTEDTKILTAIPGALTRLTPEKKNGRELPFLLELAPDAPIGAYPIRVETPDGLSNTLLFSVGPFPELLEGESETAIQEHLNDSPEKAQAVAAPFTVNGTLAEADRDFYRISGVKGQSIVFEVEARRLGSAIDPELVLRDAAGQVVARNNDAAGIWPDARLAVTFPADGEYSLEVLDARFSAQSQNFYRLKAGPLQYAEGMFPLGWKRGESIEVELFGGSLAAPVKVRPDLSPEATASGYAAVAVPGDAVSLPFRFVVTDRDESLEPSGAGPHPLPPDTVINGRIAKPAEVDEYRLAVKTGESWMIETQAAGLGPSQLYMLITLYDGKGKKLASAGDKEPDEALSFISSTGETFGDPHLGFQVPEGVSEMRITVEDLLQRGGPGYVYRLAAWRQPPDFRLTLATPYVNIPESGSATVPVTLDRRGYLGLVELKIDGLPDDVTVQGGHIPAEFGGMTTGRTSRRGVLVLTPKPGAKPRSLQLQVYGEGRSEKGELIRRDAQAPGILVGVRGARQDPVTAPWLEAALPARVVAPEPAVLEVTSPLRVRLIQGMEHEIRWAFHSRAPGVVQTGKVRTQNEPAVGNLRVNGGAQVKTGDTSGVFQLQTTMGTPAMVFDMTLACDVEVDGREITIPSPAITFEIVQGYDIEPPAEPVHISSGGKAVISGVFHRQPEFASPVTLKANNLPVGVSCSTAEIGEAEVYHLECEAGAAVDPGEYEVELAAASTLAGRDKEAVPYSIPPVSAKMLVGGEKRVAAAK
jgi:hypothetical protein